MKLKKTKIHLKQVSNQRGTKNVKPTWHQGCQTSLMARNKKLEGFRFHKLQLIVQ